MMRFVTWPRSPLLAACMLGALALSARAQGTDEQREACAPDAVRLCQDTIPDIPKTTACMREHVAELSPHCREVFEAATEAAPAPQARKPHIARQTPEPDDDTPDERPRRFRGPDPTDDEFDRARAIIGRMCDDEMIDPRTCAVTERALGGGR